MIQNKTLGKSDIKISPIGFGGATLADLNTKLNDIECYKTLEKAFNSGINYFDTAPLYGYGLSEHRLGNFLKTLNRDQFILSTKVGRYMTPADPDKIDRLIFKSTLDFSPNFDYSYDGVMRSFEQSLFRLGLSKIDICLIHDVDGVTHKEEVENRFKEAMNGAYKALEKLKSEKVIKAIGVGLNESYWCKKFAESGDFDCMILAGRYTLLEQGGLTEFLPLAKKKNIGIILAGVFNSGVLIKGVTKDSTYDYAKIPNHIIEKYNAINEVCNDFNVPIAAAAIQFSNAHSAVSTLLLGMDYPEQVQENLNLFNFKIEKEFWLTLLEKKLIDPESPIPE